MSGVCGWRRGELEDGVWMMWKDGTSVCIKCVRVARCVNLSVVCSETRFRVYHPDSEERGVWGLV